MVPARHRDDLEDVVHHLGQAGAAGVRRVHELGYERHHDHAAVCRELAQDVVGRVAEVVAERAGVRVAEDDGAAGDGQDVGHRLGRHVAQVDQHAETVHLEDGGAADGAQAEVAAARGDVGGGRGEDVVAVVGQGDVARAELVDCSDAGD